MKVLLEFNEDETEMIEEARAKLRISPGEFIKGCLYGIHKIFIGEPVTAKEHIDFFGTLKTVNRETNSEQSQNLL